MVYGHTRVGEETWSKLYYLTEMIIKLQKKFQNVKNDPHKEVTKGHLSRQNNFQ
jgi:hypothetical protein